MSSPRTPSWNSSCGASARDVAETSRAWLNFGQPAVTDLGIVLWANRSPNLYPANSGVPIAKAATVTLPATATSGLVIVREET